MADIDIEVSLIYPEIENKYDDEPLFIVYDQVFYRANSGEEMFIDGAKEISGSFPYDVDFGVEHYGPRGFSMNEDRGYIIKCDDLIASASYIDIIASKYDLGLPSEFTVSVDGVKSEKLEDTLQHLIKPVISQYRINIKLKPTPEYTIAHINYLRDEKSLSL